MRSFDVICVGGGIIGLLTAHELARLGVKVAVFDQGPIGGEASWAGAGILSPAFLKDARNDYDRLRANSFEQFPSLAEQLLESTGIDIGFRCTGGLDLPAHATSIEELNANARRIQKIAGIDCRAIGPAELAELEPHLQQTTVGGLWAPQVCQVRNPRYVKALIVACAKLGVALQPNRPVVDFQRAGERVSAVQIADGTTVSCGAVIVSAGAWSARLLKAAGCEIPVYPIRGQIVALQTSGDMVRHILEKGKQYFVPRDDGLILVGSTEEDVGFDKQVTGAGAAGLLQFALAQYPHLAKAKLVTSWAGLRPASKLSSPLLGPAPGSRNLWLATGHFRQGVQLSPGTARLLADWLTGRPSFASSASFALTADRSGHKTELFA